MKGLLTHFLNKINLKSAGMHVAVVLSFLFTLLLSSEVSAAAVIIDPNNGTSAVTVAYSQTTAGIQFTFTEAGNGTFTLTMPAGVTYIPGSMTFTSSAGAVIAESNITNLGAPVFSITGATVGANSVITYGIRSGCATQGSASIGVSVTIGSSTDTGTISISILKAALTIDAHDAAVNYTRGGSGSSTCLLTNGGNGSLDSLKFYFKQNGPLVTDSIKANGQLATYIGAVGDTLFYQLRSVHFPGGTLDNGESITITRYFHVPLCYNGSSTAFPSFQSTYLANFGRGSSRCQSPTPGDFGQYNYSTANNGDPTLAAAQIAVDRQASPCQTALVRYRITSGSTGNAAYAKLYNVWAQIYQGTWPTNGYKIKSATLVSNSAALPIVGGNINIFNSTAVQGTDPDGIGTGLEDLDNDGYFDDMNPGQNFVILIEWEYQKAPVCSNDPADHSLGFRAYGSNLCGGSISSGNFIIIAGRLHATGIMLLNSAPVELGSGQTGTMQAQVSRTAPNATYLSCPTNQWQIRFPLAPGMSVSAMRAGTTNLSFSVVSDTAVALIAGTVANPFTYEVDFSVTPGITPNGTSPTVILAYTCNSACPNSREDVSCLAGPALQIPAPGLCETGGGLTSNSLIQRITTGFTDYTGTARVPLASLLPLSRKRGLPCDSVLVTSTGGVQAGTVITGGEPLYYQVSYNLHGTTNRLFEWVGGTYTYQSATAALPAPVYEANYNGVHYAIYSLGNYPIGAVVNVSLYGIEQNAASLTNTLEGVSGFSNAFFNLDDGFSNPSPNGGDTRYACTGQALEFYVRCPRGAFNSNAVYDEGGTCNSFWSDSRTWYLRGTAGSGPEIDYFPGEVRPIDILDSIVVNLQTGFSYDPTGGQALVVRGNPNEGGYPSNPILQYILPPPIVQGQRLVWRNTGNWWIPDDALRGGYNIFYYVKSNCTANGYQCGFSVGLGAPVVFYGHTNVNSRNTSCPTAFVRNAPGTNTFSGRPVHSVTNLSGTQNADQRVECFNVKLNVSCATSYYTYIYFAGGGPSGTFNITSIKNTTTNVDYPVLQVAGGQWAQLGNVNGDLFLTICSEYSNCANPDIPYSISWGCSGYPANPASSGCSALSGTFDLSPAPSGLQAQFIAQPANPVALCDPLVYDFNVLSTLAADLVDPRLEVTIPTGMAINTVQIEYPYNSGNFETVTPAGTTGTVTIPYGLHSMVKDSLPGVNFQVAPNPRTGRIRLSFVTGCDFTSGERLLVKAKGEEPCGAPAQGNNTAVYSDPIDVAGVTQNYVTLVNNLDIGPDTIITCENRTISMDLVMINTSAFPVSLDPALDSVKIDLPAGIQYVAGSYNCTSGSNCFLPPLVSGNTLDLTLPVPTGITIPAASSVTVSFSLQINALVDGGCNTPGGFTISMVRSFPGVSCASQPGGVCPNPVKFITGSETVQISPKKANISTITARVCRSTTNNYDFSGTFTINQGAVPSMQSVLVEIYCLSGGNPVGAPVATQTVNGLLNMSSGNIPFSGNFMATCAGEEFQVRISPVTNGGADQCVCSTVSTNVGLSNPTFTVTTDDACAGDVLIHLPLNNITNGGNQYKVNFDDASITDVTTATTISGGGTLNVAVPSTLATGTYTGSVTVVNSTTLCEGTAPFSFIIHALPTIAPTTEVCVGSTTTVTGTGTPATTNQYVSSNTAVATVTSAGVISGVSVGTANITYTDIYGCQAVSALTVLPLPTLSGGAVCAGSTITLTGSGTPAAMNAYASGNMAVATVTNGGVVTGVSAGTAVITYTNSSGCQTTATVTIHPLPTMSGGSVCVGNTINVLGSGIPGSSNVYVSSNTAVATVTNGGLVTGVSVGTADITYTDVNGCQVTATVTVNALPTMAGRAVCVGSTTTLTGSGTPAASNPYISSNTAVATVTSGGVVTGVSAGMSTITYTDNNGCQVTALVMVNALPTMAGGSVCVGSTITLSGSGTPAAVNPYISSNTAVATVTSGGVVTGVSGGTSTITYTDNNGCAITATVEVNGVLSISFTNTSSCNYNATTVAGDDYFTSDITVTFPNIPATGDLVLTGDVLSGGGATTVAVSSLSGMSYTFTGVRLRADGTTSSVTATFSETGCTLTNMAGPIVASCSPVASVGDPCTCHNVAYDPNEVHELLDYIEVTAPAGETWHVISHTGLEEVNAFSNIPLAVPAMMTYNAMTGKYVIHIEHDNAVGYTATLSNGTVTLTQGNLCTQNEPVDISLPTMVCSSAAAIALPATQPNFTTIYTIGSVGGTVVTSFNPALYAGTTVELYAVHTPTNMTDCPKTVKYTIQVYVFPTMSGGTVCVGNTITLTGSGTPAAVDPYLSSNTAVATVDNLGEVTGVGIGSSTITYTNANGCQVTATVTVIDLPTLTGGGVVCLNSTATITGSGTPAAVNPYVSSNTTVATVNNMGVITGLIAGTTIITYTDNNGCTAAATVVVSNLPTMTGGGSVCTGSTITVSGSGMPAGVNPYVSSNTAVATVVSSGVVTGVSAGTATITYTNNNGCQVTTTVTVQNCCVPPIADFIAVPAECDNGVMENNGRIVLMSHTGVDRVGYSTGATYTGPAYGMATALPGTLPADVVMSIPNGTSAVYTIRVFNGANNCFRDYTVTVASSSACVVDPMGFIYCEETGEIISGGTIVVSGPGAVLITKDGTTGEYQFFTDGTPGTYMMTYTPPTGYTLSSTHTPLASIDPTGQPNPYYVGSGSTNGVTLDDFSAGANPYTFNFVLAPGDPEVQLNNIPLSGCCVPPVLTVNNTTVCRGSSVNLASLVSNAGGGSLSYYATQMDAQLGVNALASPTVTVTAATNYYVRSQTRSDCYTVKEVTVNIRVSNCSTITIAGPH